MIHHKHALLDFLLDSYMLKNDSALSKALKVQPPCLSKMRNGAGVSAEFIINVHETYEIPIAQIKALIPKKVAK